MRILSWLLCVLTFAVGLATPPAFADKAANTLRAALERPLDTIDPYYDLYRETYGLIGAMLFDTLIYENPATHEYEPLLAAEWNWVDDVTLNVKLRENVTWHDGQPFTADDVVYTFTYILNPENATTRYDQYNMIKGAEKVGEHEVKITLNAPYGAIMPTLAARIQILPEGFYGPDRKPARLVGTGPYKLQSHTPGGGAVLTLNENYFEGSPKGKPSIQTFEYVHIPETSTQIAELMAGNVDWIWRVTNEQAEQLATVPGLTVDVAGTLRNHFLYFDANGESGETPVTDVRVRQAIAHAIDRSTIAKELVRGGEDALNVPCHEAQFGCPPAEQVKQYEYDPEKARSLLAEAGHPNGFDIDMWFFSNYQHELAQAMQAYLREVGINVNLLPVTSTVLYEGTDKGEVPMAWVATGSGNILDVSALYAAYFGTSRDLTNDEELTSWVLAADATVDQAKREELYLKVAQQIMDQVYWVPLWIEGGLYAYKSELNFTAWDDEDPRFFLASWKD